MIKEAKEKESEPFNVKIKAKDIPAHVKLNLFEKLMRE